MKRLAILLIVAVLAACGSDNTGPSDKFNGSWIGIIVPDSADTITVEFNATQTGSSVIGNGVASDAGSSNGFTFTGSSTPPTLTLLLQVQSSTATYTGEYITSDSIAGTSARPPHSHLVCKSTRRMT